jgi:hypothetical protein
MKRLFLIASLVLGAVAFAGGLLQSTTYSASATTNAPDGGLQGAQLGGGRFFRVLAYAPDGGFFADAGPQILSFAGGSLDCYFRSPNSTTWMRCAAYDLALTDGGTAAISPSYATGVEAGRIFYKSTGITMNYTDGGVGAGGSTQVTIEVQP